MHRFGKGVSPRSGKYRNREQSGAEYAQREDRKSEIAGDRLQRLRRLIRGLDIGYALLVQRRGGGDDNEKSDQVGEPHSDIGIELNSPDFLAALLRRVDQRVFGAGRGARPRPLPTLARKTDRG